VRVPARGAENGEACAKSGESLDTVWGLITKRFGEDTETVELSTSLSETKELNEKRKPYQCC
jgi:hypothetical protein